MSRGRGEDGVVSISLDGEDDYFPVVRGSEEDESRTYIWPLMAIFVRL